MRERADRVEAQVAPQLEPDLVADIVAHRGVQVGGHHHFAEPGHARRAAAIRLAQRKLLAVDVLDHARRNDLSRGIDHAADRPLRPQALPLAPAGIDAFQRAAGQVAAMLVEIPVRNAVDAGDDRGFRPQQRLHLVHHARHGMRLEGDEHIVLVSELARIAGAAHLGHALLAVDQQPDTMFLHCREMGAARDEADLRPRARQLRPDIAADRACAVDTHFHCCLLDGSIWIF
ncbi:hypothetical protein D3C72_1491540 [compost metagenome]